MNIQNKYNYISSPSLIQMEIYDKQNTLCTRLHVFFNNITSYKFYKLFIIKYKN